ncbi:MAG: ATP-NAD kinase family protein [Bacillota bacterium]
MTRTVGVIVNPVAGMGGKVGLKGTDGPEALRRARELGAGPVAPQRVVRALRRLVDVRDLVQIIAAPGDMGEREVGEAGLEAEILDMMTGDETTPADTRDAAVRMLRRGMDLLIFAGGDGTARDIFNAVDGDVPVIGVPAGVKMHSAVFASDPPAAGNLAVAFLRGEVRALKEAEVMDIDEEAFREGRVSARLYGHLMVPESPLMQSLKSGSPTSEAAALEGMAEYVVQMMERGVCYVVGPGTTPRAIMQRLELQNSLLGVDVVRDGLLLVADANESELLEVVRGEPAHIVVTPIGGQGYIFGRGNQQISAEVIRTVGVDSLWVVATKGKILSLERKPMLVDTGDPEVDDMLRGYVRVIMDYRQETVYRVR